ncbi:hypothetical protein ACQ4PT_061352 [Festuca glaucescens]
MASSTGRRMVLLAATLLAILGVQAQLLPSSAAAPAPPPPTITETLDVSHQRLTGSSYLSFVADLDFAVNKTADAWITHHPLLRTQDLRNPPYAWLHIELVDAGARRLVTLAMRSDNLYIAGFANRRGDWFSFAGETATLPGATPLTYSGSYPSLFGRGVGHGGLGDVPISATQPFAFALQLATYTSGGTAPDTSLKPALRFYVLIIAESERFPSLRRAVAAALDSSTPKTVGKPLASLAVNWATMSCALIAWDHNGKTTAAWSGTDEAKKLSTELGIKTAEQALAQIQPILRAKRCSWT